MPEKHRIFSGYLLFSDHIQQACHRPAGIYRVQQNSLISSTKCYRLAFRITNNTIRWEDASKVYMDCVEDPSDINLHRLWLVLRRYLNYCAGEVCESRDGYDHKSYEIFEKIVKYIPKYDPSRGKPKAYMVTAISSKCRDIAKSKACHDRRRREIANVIGDANGGLDGRIEMYRKAGVQEFYEEIYARLDENTTGETK
jgi:hypothetical protein